MITPVADEAAQRALDLPDYYTEILTWPTTTEALTGVTGVRLGEAVDALFMRAGFACEVNHLLVLSMLHAPVIAMPGEPTTWVFLTQARTVMRESTVAELMRLKVEWEPVGTTMPLPSADVLESEPRWLVPPDPARELPPWMAVVGAARRTSSLCGAW
ncbi:hypothetical protein [Actinokineospora sp. NBRC 105648]|uniref:hypothetical protein n=1 Tax=Actinokineospora sp. NBRC 105648 TaxID=3032206 RepID=UPI00249FC74A|nr:hypothetical protein [Actinokineospora sp. NBRC 105648]GLZ37888.1 hypothetical protein Acsp05_15120 [Actinokineospora sp. NBRC 105648]